MLPLVLFPGAGSEMYRGLGSVVVGGLLVSTLFTLVLAPLLFSLVLEMDAAFRRLLGMADPIERLAEGGQSDDPLGPGPTPSPTPGPTPGPSPTPA